MLRLHSGVWARPSESHPSFGLDAVLPGGPMRHSIEHIQLQLQLRSSGVKVADNNNLLGWRTSLTPYDSGYDLGYDSHFQVV